MELESLALKNLKYKLFTSRRFLPMFLSIFLGTFNDNLIRSGLIVLITYAAKHDISLSIQPEILVTICYGLLVLPMVLFSSIAGELADKYEKSRLVVFTKIAEIFIVLIASYGFYYNDINLLMVMLFISGTHTAFNVPIKFSILPQHLQHGELLAGNGFIASGSYLAILIGMIVGGIIIEYPNNLIGTVAIIVAIIGFIASLFIPPAPSTHPHTKISFNLWKGSMSIIRHARKDDVLVRTILALSWFITVGSIYISQFANYARGVIHADNEVYILFLTVFSVGTAIGSLLCDTLLKSQISTRFTPISAIGIALFSALMVYFTPVPMTDELMTIREFFSVTSHLLVLACMLMVAICGGLYIVPLYALLQSRTSSSHRSQIIAASNLSDSLSMTIAAVVSAILLSYGLGVKDLFIIVAFLTLAVAWYVRKIVA
jgi:acyl-[acyl-carrier-protein]-phospholipid O-acyltransferase/long-chain-fatty-acid--[acyl-carrier-protein] ligase